jgi:hypothetical protein
MDHSFASPTLGAIAAGRPNERQKAEAQAQRVANAKRNRLEAFFREDETWNELALPMLKVKLAKARTQLETAKPEEATIRILRGLVEDPAAFLDIGPQ